MTGAPVMTRLIAVGGAATTAGTTSYGVRYRPGASFVAITEELFGSADVASPRSGKFSGPFCQSRKIDLKTGRSMLLSHSGKLPVPVSYMRGCQPVSTPLGAVTSSGVSHLVQPISACAPRSTTWKALSGFSSSVCGFTSRETRVTAWVAVLTNRIGPPTT